MNNNSNDKPVRRKLRHKRRISKRRRVLQKFIAIVFCMVCMFLIVAGAATISYISKTPTKIEGSVIRFEDDDNDSIVMPKEKDDSSFIAKIFPPKNIRTNFVMLGLDEDKTRSDVIIVGSFDPETKIINLLSIPRDTRITMPKDRVSLLKAEGRWVPSDGVMKINEVHSYSGSKHNTEFTVLQIEELLDIKIDYYAKIDLEAFRYIVDTLGGVDIEIPKGGLYYSDPLQNLYINLPGGMQHLNGKKAEQFVRFRGYADADISRIKAQQTFLKELFKQVFNKKNIIENLPSYINGFFKYVETNFNIADVPKYIAYVNDIDPSAMQTYSLPGEAEYIEVSYFLHDANLTRELVLEIFTDSGSKNLDEIEEKNDSKDKKIEVANGGTINGLANKKKEELINDGYDVVKTSTFNGVREGKTRIIVTKAGMGEDLHDIFKDSVLVVDPSQISSDIDIKIILGLNEK